ncbi:MAG: hypothetical protein ACREDS_13725 [Limisphaerales bacterium]
MTHTLYFREHLRVGDYYMEGRSVSGQWITGKSLRELALALQDRCVEFVKPLPERYASLVGDEVSVRTIEIEDEKERG